MPGTDHYTAHVIARSAAAHGVRHVVISPGSRSAPLVRAFHDQPGIACHVVIDERSAGFIALGMADRSGTPVALICTSGSAVLNHAPAVAEAFYRRIPLLVLSADRPEEWVDQGEGQTIRQRGALSAHVRYEGQLPRSVQDDLARHHADRLVQEALEACTGMPNGPVHLNVPFTEPLYGASPGALPEPYQRVPTLVERLLPEEVLTNMLTEAAACERVLVLAGQGAPEPSLLDALVRLAQLPQVVVLSEATSNLDHPDLHGCIDRTLPGVDPEVARPDLLITFGGDVVSKRIKERLREWRPDRHWHLDPAGEPRDTYQCLTRTVAVAPTYFLTWLAGSLDPVASGYGDAWRSWGASTTSRHEQLLADAPFCDLVVFQALMDRLKPGMEVHLANSTPVRYAQLFDRPQEVRWHANRGTSGIDGCTSTALGSAFIAGRPTLLITGDVAFLYDSNAFWNGLATPGSKVVVIDNGGGNIFRYIPGPDRDKDLLPYFETPHGRDPLALAGHYGLATYEAFDRTSLQQGLEQLFRDHDRPAVLVVRTDPGVSPRVLRAYFEGLAGDRG